MGSPKRAQGQSVSQAATTGSQANEHSVQNGRYSPHLVLEKVVSGRYGQVVAL